VDAPVGALLLPVPGVLTKVLPLRLTLPERAWSTTRADDGAAGEASALSSVSMLPRRDSIWSILRSPGGCQHEKETTSALPGVRACVGMVDDGDYDDGASAGIDRARAGHGRRECCGVRLHPAMA